MRETAIGMMPDRIPKIGEKVISSWWDAELEVKRVDEYGGVFYGIEEDEKPDYGYNLIEKQALKSQLDGRRPL